MAQIPNTRALTASTDGSDAGTVFNVNTATKQVQIPNGASIQFYSDAYATATGQLTGSGPVSAMSATSPDPGAGGTIATAGVGVALVTPAAARTGIILQAGTVNGQEVWVVNQGAAANTLTFHTTPATSNVADSATEPAIAGLKARKYVWVSAVSLWYPAQ
ncbi:MAG TPA: hypothetical protein VHE33_06035 [Acidobacteriaceae bacterium]|nr:hypothetical protein [Acidobacteriaceae bacterium]HVU67537.1 hypothetical protein [Ktedonobacteraceae bacterium]